MKDDMTPIERAAAQLRAAVGEMPEMTRRAGAGWRPAIAFVGAAVVVVLAIGLPAIVSQTGVEPEGAEAPSSTAVSTPGSTTSTTRQAPTTMVATVAACGIELPFTTELPDDFDGPYPGPSADSPDSAEEGQFILHWTGRGGSVELRFPANSEYTESAQWGALSTPEDFDHTVFVIVQDVTIDGVAYPDAPQPYGVLPTEAMSGPCDAVQLRILGPAEGAEPSLLGGTFGIEDPDRPNTLVLYPELPRARDLHLIVDSLSVDAVPAVLECGGGPGVTGSDVPPIKSESIADPVVYEKPVEALEMLLAGPDAASWPKTGYFELREPDGSITYGNPLDDMSPDPRPDNGLVISISVVKVERGWAVESWSTSGC